MKTFNQGRDNILFVDDEQAILDGFRRNLRKVCSVHTANSGEEGLAALEKQAFAVVVSDMSMPGMNGVTFLRQVRERWPDTVRVMLTGYADIENAMAAVNEGHIFRFITKPVSQETLVNVLAAALEQHRLICAEHELLENTLTCSIQVLVDMLAMTNPAAFSRAQRVRRYVAQMADHLALPDCWQYEVAASLSQLGCVTVPASTLEKGLVEDDLSDQEQKMVAAHPAIGEKLIASIPRLEGVARMIGRQNQDPDYKFFPGDPSEADPVQVGGHLLKLVLEFDRLLFRGAGQDQAVNQMEERGVTRDHRLLVALRKINVPKLERVSSTVSVRDLRNGMVLEEDIRTTNGMLVAAHGQELNDTIRQRLKNFSLQNTIPEQVRVSRGERSFT
jgi:response regulator RpfG family c-di-GMP phosphodiesterase